MATPVTKPIASTIELITAANSLSERLQLLLSNDTQHVIKTNRDGLVLLHWSLIFEHHQGMLLLLRNGFPASAFALMRPLEEAFLRSFVAMNGTDEEAVALWKGTYKTKFEVVWKQIYAKIGLQSNAGPWKLSATTTIGALLGLDKPLKDHPLFQN